jgi:hypothetical protein
MLVFPKERRELFFRVYAHRAELEHLELAAVAAHAGLCEDDRTTVEAYEHADEHQNGAQDKERRKASNHVQRPLCDVGASQEPLPSKTAKGHAEF